MSTKAPQFAVVLAAGKGSRMQSVDRHKVCFPVDGQPVINRSLAIYQQCGIRKFIVVVGAMAGQVVETVGQQFPGAIFAYQAEQLGTAHAVRQGLLVLSALGGDEDVLLVPGDRVIEPVVLEQLFHLYYSEACAMAFVTMDRRAHSDQGRIVCDSGGSVLGNLEWRDIRQRAVYHRIREDLAQDRVPAADRIIEYITTAYATGQTALNEKKIRTAFGRLWEIVAGEKRSPGREELLRIVPEALTRFDFIDAQGAPVTITPGEQEKTARLNTSVYVIQAGALRFALSRLDRNNAQQEEYLSDIITILCQSRNGLGPAYRVRQLHITNPHAVMGFNDPAGLLEIEAHLRSQKSGQAVQDLPFSASYRTLEEWRSLFARVEQHGSQEPFWDNLTVLYGDDPVVVRERILAYQLLIAHAGRDLKNTEPVFLVRSPGRVNLMGRHIDHQGGNCNLMTIGYETLMAVHPRPDDLVTLANVDGERFPPARFSIGELVSALPWDNWLSLVNSEQVARIVHTTGGAWSNYITAAVLRLQKKFNTVQLRGMDLVISGNVPMAAGLSSSSTLVVGTAEAVTEVNRLETFPAQLVDLCGEGEWFVGTRGGSADHAAVKLGQKGKIVKVKFFDFAVEDVVPFPDECVLVVCDSGIKAHKSKNAKNQFNHRVACYRLGVRLIKKLFPQYAHLVQHLRDVNTRTLNIPLSWIYKLLLHLPETTTRAGLRQLLAPEDIGPLFADHEEPADGQYPIRGVVLYGLAECERSRKFAEFLKSRNSAGAGHLMNISHDGDRVARFMPDGTEIPYRAPVSNAYLLNLIEDLDSGDVERVTGAQLDRQPGAYACSVPDIDRMVTIALATPGVLGAQLAGAGLGGCMMVMVRREAVEALHENLAAGYYRPGQKPVSVFVCHPIAGSGILGKKI